jgi:hypothetical protein
MMKDKEPHTPTPELPEGFHLPTERTLLKATGIAAAIATVVLLLFILPAEYGVDPTGFGGLVGINGIADSEESATYTVESEEFRNDTVQFVIPARSGLEYKFEIQEGSAMLYSWSSTGAMFYDFHGEPTDGPAGYFESYETGTNASGDGSFNAPFNGTHGWYWQNSGNTDITVTLSTAGHYNIVGVK